MNRTVGLILALMLLAPIIGAQEAAQPLMIDQAVQTALANNLTIRSARQEVSAARARISSAESARFPQVEANVQHTRLTNVPDVEIPSLGPGIPPQTFSISAKSNTVASIIARQAIYTGGRVSAQVSRAEAQYDLAVARLGVTEADVALQTREGYYGVLLAQSLVRSAEQSLSAAQAQLKTATDRFEVGTAARFDVLRAQTQVSEAEQTLTESRNQVEISGVALNRVLGLPLDKPLALAEPTAAPQPAQNMAELIETANQRRGELLVARAQVAAAESGIRLARADRLPQLGASANYQKPTNDTPALSTGWTFMATASLEIFDGGRIRANTLEAKALTEEARINLQDTSRAVEQDVRQANLNLQAARQTVETARTRLAQAQEAYEVATVRYEEGVGTAVEVADALATLAAARTNLDRATFDYDTADARLQRALGNVE